jgi:Leucine-rich repeat (LRR) protein
VLESLRMRNVGKVSAVPPDLFTLKSLTELDLRENPQFVELPSQIGELVNLELLDLYGNGFKTIPATIGKLSKLRTLDLRNNAFSSENIPPQLGRCEALEKLLLSQNVLTSVPLEVTDLKLKASDTCCVSCFFSSFFAQELDLANNVLTSVGAEIGNLKSLQRLDISGNKLLSLPPEIGACTELRVLQLKVRRCVASSLLIFCVVSFFVLTCSQTNELSTLPADLGKCLLLEKLDLAHNMITQLPVEMGQLTRLKLLDLEYNSLIFPPRKKIAEGTDAILLFLRQMQADRDKNGPKSPRK